MKKEMRRELKLVGGHFPDRQQTLLLKAALMDKPLAFACFEEWLQSYSLAYLKPESSTFLTDFMDTLDLGSQRMLPLVIHNLGENAHPYFKFLSGNRKNYWVKTKQILFNARKVKGILEENGIPCLLIKGLDLAGRYYPNDALRPMSDGDILIPFSFRKRALEIAGKGLLGDRIGAYDHYMKNYRHGIHLKSDRQESDVDLHWNIFREYANVEDSSGFIWESLTDWHSTAGTEKRMSDTAAFFVSLVHGRSFEAVPPFRWVADVMLIYRNAGNLDWNELLSLCRKFHFKPFVKRAFRYLSDEFEMKIPEDFATELEKIQPGELEERYYTGISETPAQGSRFLRFISDFRKRVVFYRLFLKQKRVPVLPYFIGWYTNMLKTKLFPGIR